MEIEAKYIVPDKAAAIRLSKIERVADLWLSATVRHVMRDTYFDTLSNDLLRTRHVLRVRMRNDGHAFLTFKAPAQKSGAIHQRPETEVALATVRTPRILRVNELPARIRKLVAPFAADSNLYPMFSITQRRLVRHVKRERKIIAEWSLDHVQFRAGKRKHEFYELEIELKKEGTRDELEKIVRWLESEFKLQPQTESKFKRALDFHTAQ